MPSGEETNSGHCLAFHHLTFWVSNAKQSAHHFIAFFGFKPLAFKSLETGCRDYASHAVQQGDIIFVFVSPLATNDYVFGDCIRTHGDFVKDIAFLVDDLDQLVSQAVSNGATIVKPIWTEEDAGGKVRFATIATAGDMTHTLVEKNDYTGIFLPHFAAPSIRIPFDRIDLTTGLEFIDHCVTTRPENSIDNSSDWYQKALSFHRFWSVDDVAVQTEKSSLKFLVVANRSETIKMTILEPASGERKSQVQEFNEYNGGPGTQHVALHTKDIVKSELISICFNLINIQFFTAVRILRSLGVDFLTVPSAYYKILREKLKTVHFTIDEDLEDIEKENILLDYDENGYLLQIFTKPLQDRPTLFLEIIQRHNHNGFGAGNFRTLFLAVEQEQQRRGNL